MSLDRNREGIVFCHFFEHSKWDLGITWMSAQSSRRRETCNPKGAENIELQTGQKLISCFFGASNVSVRGGVFPFQLRKLEAAGGSKGTWNKTKYD